MNIAMRYYEQVCDYMNGYYVYDKKSDYEL